MLAQIWLPISMMLMGIIGFWRNTGQVEALNSLETRWEQLPEGQGYAVVINHHTVSRREIDKKSASQVALVVKNLPANAGDVRDVGWIPGWGRSPKRGYGKPLQYSCLRILWTKEPGGLLEIYRVTKSQTQLK